MRRWFRVQDAYSTGLEKALDELSIAELFEGYKEMFCEDAVECGRQFYRDVIEYGLESDLRFAVAQQEPPNARNGYRQRRLVTPLGEVTVSVPRLREGSYDTQVLEPYQRVSPSVEELLEQLYSDGLSTRRAGPALENLLGIVLSAQTVSGACEPLDRKVREFHRRQLQDRYHYLIVDGLYIAVRRPVKVKRVPVLAAVGLTDRMAEAYADKGVGPKKPSRARDFSAGRSGGTQLVKVGCGLERELVDFMICEKESEVEWTRFFNSLYQRGLKGESLRAVTSDGSAGLKAALGMVFPWVEHQRCWVHKLRNVSTYLKAAQRENCLKGAKAIYQAETLRDAGVLFQEWKRSWKPSAEKAVRCLERDLPTLLEMFRHPKEHRRAIRTTNGVERAFREVRRRTDSIGAFVHSQSLERIIYVVVIGLNGRWRYCTGRRST